MRWCNMLWLFLPVHSVRWHISPDSHTQGCSQFDTSLITSLLNISRIKIVLVCGAVFLDLAPEVVSQTRYPEDLHAVTFPLHWQHQSNPSQQGV